MAGAQFCGLIGENRQADPHEGVGAELQEDRSQEHRPDRRGRGMRIGQPGVEGEHRDLHREAEEERGEHPEPEGCSPETGPADFREHLHAEGVHAVVELTRLEVEREEAQQHERRAEQREQEELDRGIEPHLSRVLEDGQRHLVAVAPDPDHEVHRQQNDLEEHEEEDEVERHEGPGHPGGEHEDQGQERLGVVRLGPVLPRIHDGEHGDERGQHEERQRDAVEPDDEPGVDRTDPRQVGPELVILGIAVIELDRQHDRQHEGRAGEQQAGRLLGLLVRLGNGEHRRGPDQGQEHHEAQAPSVLEPTHVCVPPVVSELLEKDESADEQDGACDQQCGVLLHPTTLDAPQQPSGCAGRRP